MEVLKLVEEMKKEGKLLSSKIKVKEFSKILYPLNCGYYLNNNLIDEVDIKKITVNRMVEEPEIEITHSEELTLEKLNIVTKADWKELFVSARIYNQEIVEVETLYGVVRPLYFPREDSNIAIYANKKLETSYVNDGRLITIEGRLFMLSSNQLAIEKFLKSRLKKDENSRKSLKHFLSSELFPREEDGEIIDEEKSIMFIDKVELMDFPQMENGEPYNRGWGYHFNLFEEANANKEIRKRMRFSSLSQNGETAFIGKVKNRFSVRLEGTITKSAYEIDICGNTFVDSNAKLDISATQGCKSCFKTVNKNEEVLVVLCELWKNGFPVNINGNCVSTKEAYDTYKTILTETKAKEAGIKYPAHKVFIYKKGEIIRVKGACSIENFFAYPEGEPKSIIKKVVCIPPREIKHNGVEIDTKKFESLSEGKEIKRYTIEFNGEKFNCLGIMAKVSEDPHHSAVYSIKDKEQNHNYYGALSEIYRNNGFDMLIKFYEDKLDHAKIENALNTCGLETCGFKEIDIKDFDL